MKRKVFYEIAVVISVLICFVLCFELMASASYDVFSKSGSDLSGTPVDINIVSPQVILQGKEMQMVYETSNSATYVPVKWSSSNPDIISCTEDGKIKGLTKGKATITVKTSNNKSSDSITVYCAKKFSEPETVGVNFFIFWINRTPFFWDIEKINLNLGFFTDKFPGFLFLPNNSAKVTVLGYYDSYYYVEYKEGEELCRGLIWSKLFANSVGSKEIFRQLSYYNIALKVGTSSGPRLTTNYKGNVDWTVSDEKIVSFDKSTGKITAKKPGIAIITAKVGTTRKSCMVYSVSQWYEPETAIATKDITIRETPSATGGKVGTVLSGASMTADGDLEDGTRWVYVTSGDKKGFVHLNDFPGIDYLMTEYHYYDQGFEVRFGSGYEKIRDYSSVLNDIMMRIFGLKISQHIEYYTSLADNCKIKTFGSVNKDTIKQNCSKSSGHNANSCINYFETRKKFLTDKGQGSEIMGKCLWTGHDLEPRDLPSAANTFYKIILFNSLGVSAAIYNDKVLGEEYVTKAWFLYEITHETAHLLGAEDGYCTGIKPGNETCSNAHCYSCNKKIPPDCIMVKNTDNPEIRTSVFCEECIEIINNHLSNHH